MFLKNSLCYAERLVETRRESKRTLGSFLVLQVRNEVDWTREVRVCALEVELVASAGQMDVGSEKEGFMPDLKKENHVCQGSQQQLHSAWP